MKNQRSEKISPLKFEVCLNIIIVALALAVFIIFTRPWSAKKSSRTQPEVIITMNYPMVSTNLTGMYAFQEGASLGELIANPGKW